MLSLARFSGQSIIIGDYTRLTVTSINIGKGFCEVELVVSNPGEHTRKIKLKNEYKLKGLPHYRLSDTITLYLRGAGKKKCEPSMGKLLAFIGINAPRDISVHREEIQERIYNDEPLKPKRSTL